MTFPRLIIYLAKNEQLVQHIKVQLLKSRRLSSHIKQSSQRLRYVAEIYSQNICGMSSISMKSSYFELRFEMQRKFFKTLRWLSNPVAKGLSTRQILILLLLDPSSPLAKKKMRKAMGTIYDWSIIKRPFDFDFDWALPDCWSVGIYHNGACLLNQDLD